MLCAAQLVLPAYSKKFAQIELFNFWSYNQVGYTRWEATTATLAASALPHTMPSRACLAGWLAV